MTEERRSRATEAFFGRRKGKPLRNQQVDTIENLLPLLKIDLESAPPQNLAALFPADVRPIRLEIGFGGGEHLAHRAVENPETGFIGVEPFVNSMAKLLAAVRERELMNIRLYDDDATQLLDWLPEGSIDHIDLLYPDPWPKKKHWKRRFVSDVNLARFHRVLKPGGKFCFASDIDTYVNWTLQHCARHGGFEWTATSADDWRTPYANWPGTRYENKAKREGRSSAYLTFIRR
ncbi:tRNA (guanosine(46)-N7)-methyltransferase TrmB [Agrobacterium salinitolerans]|uniref:tRNA (guanine-N(7)-)-methyltransferase n=1 Tax=Agrobacterium salinitolerans TaxID=1183413 RepID=A0A9X3KS14_9HYPH|nr:tRNA (guanosine(46)-N7)-methyltransferase TrmB [Agrobacterium salinitolerans]MCZ7850777.1 tRNA (guanosine(46)-N7)-methyltransferase TrmB [Agrobacterium salinitolerans]MCZ7856465.1 tRNA (guanosine(46)-N7)-methyltransferase TrmB [Agrobacterium salinitolerans]MCZ7938926.1 tRNA (guanosine(46)-N7)-methyltransferase TrmB [Agrobacterium salinitolerans]MCZ7974439.1 tRNA (guanosine(46)-N7)-methyltransferase TrmB [Agrobacterium salinitolerans]